MLKNNRRIFKLFFSCIFAIFLFCGVYLVMETKGLYHFINNSGNSIEVPITQEETFEKEEKEKNIKWSYLERPLIQTVGEQEEILGLIHLDLLEVETNKEENIERAKQRAIPTITRISMGDYYGSGAILAIEEENIILISNQHLIKEGAFGEVTFFNGAKAQGEVIGTSSNYDVGFMKVKVSDIPYNMLKELRYVSIDSECYETLDKGDEIVLIGSSDGAAKSIYEGTIGDMWWYFEEFDSYMIYNYCYAKQGMSGGGTFDAHGHYIGMITGGNKVESASLPLVTIVEEYKLITQRGLEFSVS